MTAASSSSTGPVQVSSRPDSALRTLTAIGGLVGAVSLEVFGQLRNTVTQVAELHEHTLLESA